MDTPVPTPRMITLFQAMFAHEETLWSHHRLRDQGQYVARLVAEAIGAHVLSNGVNKGADLSDATYGRVEVRSRRHPLDGRREDRIQVPLGKRGLFDHLAHVVLERIHPARATG